MQASVSPVDNVDSVTINGVIATKVGNVYEANVTLVEGENTIRVVATPKDSKCATMTEVIKVTRQTAQVCTAPIDLTITSPVN